MSLTGAVRSLFVEFGIVDKTTGTVKQIDSSISAIGQNAAKASVQLDLMGNRITEVAKAGKDYRNVFLGLGAGLGVGGALGFGYLKEGTEDLAQYNDAMVTFRKNLGKNTDGMLSDLKQASNGVISETELIQKANLAMLLGIREDALVPMTKMARAAARQLGGDVNYFYESLMVGTARQSKLWLDNLGIIIDIDEANKKYAQTLGISANKLTTEQEKIAFVNEVLKHQDDLLKRVDFSQESLAEELQASAVTWAELKREMAQGALPVISAVVKSTNTLLGVLRALPEPAKGVIGIIGVLAVGTALLGSAVLLNAAAFMYLKKEMLETTGTATMWGAAQVILTGESGLLTGATTSLSGSFAALAASEAMALWWLLPLVAAGYLLWDVFNKGWDESLLGKGVAAFNEKWPYLAAGIQVITSALQTLWSWIVKIPDTIAAAWKNVTDHPLFKIAAAAFSMTPIGLAINSARLVNGTSAAAVPTAQQLVSSSSSVQSVRMGDTHITMKNEIHTQNLDEKQVNSLFSKAAKRAADQTRKDFDRDLLGATQS